VGVSTAARGEKKSERPTTPTAPPPQHASYLPQLPTHTTPPGHPLPTPMLRTRTLSVTPPARQSPSRRL